MEFSETYIEDLLVRMAHHSTGIEGNTLTQAETISVLLHNYIPREMNEREYYEVKNYKKAVEFLLENREKISVDKIKKYHELIMANLVDNNGKFKIRENLIIGADFTPTKPYQVPYALQEWCDNVNYRLENTKNKKEKIEIILDEHIKFEKIHPFSDGNGRTGRMLIIDLCLQEEIMPIIIPKNEKGKYINYLHTENTKEFTKWGIELEKNESIRYSKFNEEK